MSTRAGRYRRIRMREYRPHKNPRLNGSHLLVLTCGHTVEKVAPPGARFKFAMCPVADCQGPAQPDWSGWSI